MIRAPFAACAAGGPYAGQRQRDSSLWNPIFLLRAGREIPPPLPGRTRPPSFWLAGHCAETIFAAPIPRRSGERESRGTCPSGAVCGRPLAA